MLLPQKVEMVGALADMPDVVIYCTPGCGRCQAAREFFEARGLGVLMRDVANDFGALRQMVRRSGGARTVPVIELGGEVFVGFDPGYWRARLGGGQ